MFIDLEEKHMQFEERMKERDHEFQKEMMKMMVNLSNVPTVLITTRILQACDYDELHSTSHYH